MKRKEILSDILKLKGIEKIAVDDETWYQAITRNFILWTDPTIPKEFRSDPNKFYEYIGDRYNYYGEILFTAITMGLIFTYISTKFLGSEFRRSFQELFSAHSRGYVDQPYVYSENIFRTKSDYVKSNLEKERKRKNFISQVINELKSEGFVKTSEFIKEAQEENSALKYVFMPLRVMSNLVGNLMPDALEKNNVVNFFVQLALGLVGIKLGLWIGQKLFLGNTDYISPTKEVPDQAIRREYEKFRTNSALKSFLQEVLYKDKTITLKDLEKAKNEKDVLNFMKAASYEDQKSLKEDINLLLINYGILAHNETVLTKLILENCFADKILKQAQQGEDRSTFSGWLSSELKSYFGISPDSRLSEFIDLDTVIGLAKLVVSVALGFYAFKMVNYVYNYGTTYVDSLRRYLTQSMAWRRAVDEFNSSLGTAKRENLFVDYSEPNIELLKLRALEDAGYFDTKESLKARTRIY